MSRITKNTMGMFDCLKGAIMVFVILVHCYTDVLANNSVASPLEFRMMLNLTGLSMAALFLCSGYGFKPIKNKKALKNQFNLLVKPCVTVYVCCFLARIPWNLLQGRSAFDGLVERLLGFVLGLVWYGDYAGVQVYSIQIMWYVLALFLDWLVLSAVFRLKKENQRAACVLALTVLGLVLTTIFGVMPFCIGQVLLSVGYVYAGYVLKKKNWFFTRIPLWGYGLMGVVSAFCLLFGDANIGSCNFKLGLIDFGGILCASFLCLKLYLWLFDPECPVFQPFMFCGKNSLMILFIHAFDHQTFSWRSFLPFATDRYHVVIWVFFVLRLACIIGVLFGLQKYKNLRLQMKFAKKGTNA